MLLSIIPIPTLSINPLIQTVISFHVIWVFESFLYLFSENKTSRVQKEVLKIFWLVEVDEHGNIESIVKEKFELPSGQILFGKEITIAIIKKYIGAPCELYIKKNNKGDLHQSLTERGAKKIIGVLEDCYINSKGKRELKLGKLRNSD